jgi:hypothetical protein
MKKPSLIFVFLPIALFIGAGSALAQEIRVNILEGEAWVSQAGPNAAEQAIDKGQQLGPGQVIRTQAGAKLELLVPGIGILRLGPSSVLRVTPSPVGRQAGSGSPACAVLVSGNLWANADMGDHQAPMAIATGTCLAKTKNGVFRMTVHPDHTLEVRDYGGTIEVSGVKPPPASSPKTTAPATWEYQLTLHTKIVVWSNGRATRPFRFVAEGDLTPWVEWNLQRDGAAAGPPSP